MSLVSKLAKMSADDRAKFLAEQIAAATMLSDKAENLNKARAAMSTACDDIANTLSAAIVQAETAATEATAQRAAEIAKQFGIDVSALSGKSSLAGTTVPMRYRNPADHTQAWSGRGRAPLWIEAIGGLGNCEDLRPVAAKPEVIAAKPEVIAA